MKSVPTHQGQYVVLNEFLIFVAKLFSTDIFVIVPLPSGPFPFDYIEISQINARWLCQLMRVCHFIHCFLLLSDKNTLESNWQKFIVANSELNMPMVSAAAVAPRKRTSKATLSGAIHLTGGRGAIDTGHFVHRGPGCSAVLVCAIVSSPTSSSTNSYA